MRMTTCLTDIQQPFECHKIQCIVAVTLHRAVVSKETFHSRPSLKIHFQLKSFEVKKRKRRNSPLPGEYLNPSCCYIAYVLIS